MSRRQGFTNWIREHELEPVDWRILIFIALTGAPIGFIAAWIGGNNQLLGAAQGTAVSALIAFIIGWIIILKGDS